MPFDSCMYMWLQYAIWKVIYYAYLCTAESVHKILHLGIHVPLIPPFWNIRRLTAMTALWTSLGKPNTVYTHYLTQEPPLLMWQIDGVNCFAIICNVARRQYPKEAITTIQDTSQSRSVYMC